MRTPPAILVTAAIALGCSTPAVTSLPAASSSTAAPSAAPPAPPATAALAEGACGPLGCRLFDTPAAALRAVLASKPLVLAVGEAHAQKGSEGVASSAKRFTLELLPELQGKASDLLVELMAPPRGCKAKTEAVRTKQKEVTQHQAEADQNEYVQMGEAAKKQGVVPDLLRPTCADLDAIDRAGEGAIAASLGTIARLTRERGKELLGRNAKAGAEKIVVTYGGAMHNDVAPPEARREWSFGPDLAAATGGRYVELDLFVPEFIQDSESWRKLPWYPHYNRAAHPDKATLFEPAPGSYVLILPATPR